MSSKPASQPVSRPAAPGAEDVKDPDKDAAPPRTSGQPAAPASMDVAAEAGPLSLDAIGLDMSGAAKELAAEAEAAVDGAEEATEEVTKKKGFAGKIRALIPFKMEKDDVSSSGDDRKRTWEFTFSLRAMQNVTTVENLKVFFCISVIHEKLLDGNGHKKPLTGVLPRFTSVYNLPKAEKVFLPVPVTLHDQKKLQLSYKELQKYCVQVDMWQVSALTFNQYYGWAKRSFKDLVTREAATNLILQRKQTRKEMSDKKLSKSRYDVATFECIIGFEEFKKFVLVGDHWSMDMNKYEEQCNPPPKGDTPVQLTDKQRKQSKTEFNERVSKKKRLYFQVPPNKFVLADRPGMGLVGGKPTTYFACWNKTATMLWQDVGKFIFSGTRTHLRMSYFIVSVYMGNPSSLVVQNEQLQGLKQGGTPIASGAAMLGKAMLAFTSILDISVLKGFVKQCSGSNMQVVAELTGNMKCQELSMGMKENEHEVGSGSKLAKLYAGGQPVSSGTVSHLNKHEKYLVVKVKQCRDLPMSKPAAGCSDPYLRIKWDNMEQRCPKLLETLRPIFNQNFYFPVRSVFMDRLKRKKRPAETAALWKQELQSKGPLKIEVWDDDIASSEYLGGARVDIGDIIESKTKEDRDLFGEIKKEKHDDEDDDDDEPPPEIGKQWFQKATRTRVYDCKTNGQALVGSGLSGSSGQAKVFFETYFFHDIVEVKELPEDEDGGSKEDNFWDAQGKKFNRHAELFQQIYMVPFPNAVGAKASKPKVRGTAGENLRIFTNRVVDPEGDPGDMKELMCFLTPIIVPEALSTPMDKMHWINCLSWEPTSTKQCRTGLVPDDGWKAPSFILTRRKGASQCHALVLCSLLLGGNIDAYVCKGTIYATMPAVEGQAEREQLVEHCWVMTREDGWVTFWEPMNGKLYHLPKRYTPEKEDTDAEVKKKKKKKKEDKADPDALEDEDDKPPELLWEGEAADSILQREDIEGLPTTRRQPKAKSKVAKSKDDVDVAQKKKDEIIRNRENLPFAPNRTMLNADTLSNYIPYDSIDVVFNTQNIWANNQNHNPALITFDIPLKDAEPWKDGDAWFPFLKASDRQVMLKESIEIDSLGEKGVSLARELDASKTQDLRREIIAELEENLRLYRNRKGYDCMMDKNDYTLTELRNFLKIQELISTLDPDAVSEKNPIHTFDPDPLEGTSTKSMKDYLMNLLHYKPFNKNGSVFMTSGKYSKYRDSQKSKYKKLERMIKDLLAKKEDFQVKRNKEFTGLTVHFSTSEVEDMRSYLMRMPKYMNLIDIEHDDVYYTIQCEVFALPGGVQSVWVFVGAQEKPVEPKVDR